MSDTTKMVSRMKWVKKVEELARTSLFQKDKFAWKPVCNAVG